MFTDSSFPTVLCCSLLPLLLTAPATGIGTGVETQQEVRSDAQDAPDQADQALANHRRFLARSPYHTAVFEQLLERLTVSGTLDAIVTEYEAEHAAHPEERATTVVLARLRGAQGEAGRALELIAELASGAGEQGTQARLLHLRARLLLVDGQRAAAIRTLGQAADLSQPGAFQQEVLELRAAAQLAGGDRDGARETLLRLAAGAADHEDHMQAAERLARSGFGEEAAAEFRIAAEADPVPQHRSEALAALGRELERLARAEEATQVYLEALGLLAHDHWLARDLRTRILVLHERGGRLPELVASYQQTLAEQPTDRGAHEALAGALERSGQRDAALEILAAAVERFPDDLALSRARLDTARRARDTDQLIAEYQRLLAARPEDAELRFELGEEFAVGGRVEQAAEQWSQLLDRHPDDPDLTRRVAQRWTVYGRADRARELFERAVDQNPGEVERYADLAKFLRQSNEAQAALDWLQRGEQALADSPGSLDRLSDIFLEQGHGPEALRALLASLALDPSVSQRRYRLAGLQFRQGRVQDGLASLRRVALKARELELRDLAARDFARRHNPGDAERLAEDLPHTLVTPDSPAARLLVIALRRRSGDQEKVEADFVDLLAAHPDDPQSRLWFATWLVEQDRTQEALEAYAWLERRLPERALEFLFARTSLHLVREEREAAVACLETAYTGASADPVIAARIARRMLEAGRAFRSAEMWEDVLRMPLADLAGHLELARLYQGMSRPEAARRHLLAAWSSADNALREEAAAVLHAQLRRTSGLETLLRELDARLAVDPFDLESALLACELLSRDGRGAQALTRVDDLLALSPHEASLLRQRARVLLSLGRAREALGDLDTLHRDGVAPGLDMVEATLAAGGVSEAVELASRLDDPASALPIFAEHPGGELTLLEILASRPAPSLEILPWLANLYEKSDRLPEAIATWERYRERQPNHWPTELHIARLRGRAGERDVALARGRELLISGADHSAVRRLFDELAALDQFFVALADAMIENADDEEQIREFLTTLVRERRTGVAIETLRALRMEVISSGQVASGHTLESWTRWLGGAELGFYREKLGLARRRGQRLKELVKESLGQEKRCTDLLYLLSFTGNWEGDDLALLRRIHARYPRSPVILTAVGRALESGGHWAAAERAYSDLSSVLREPKNQRETRLAEARAWSWHVTALEPVLRSEGIVDREALDAALRLALRAQDRETWEMDLVLTPQRARWRRGVCLAQAGRKAEAAELLTGESVDGRSPLLRYELLEAQISAGMVPQACAQLIEVLRNRRRLLNRPELWIGILSDTFDRELARTLGMLAERGHTAQAYDAMRSQGFVQEARQYLHRKRNHDLVATHYTAKLRDARSTLDAVDGSDVQGRERALRLVHDLTIKLAEVHRERGGDGPVQAEVLWNDLDHLHPGDLAVLTRKARTAEWNDAWDEAAATHRELVQARAALAELPPALRRIWAGQLLTPANPPPDAAGRVGDWQKLRARARTGGMLDPTADWLGVLYAELMLSDYQAAVQTVDQLLSDSARWRALGVDIETLLATEEFGPQSSRVKESLDRWRAKRPPADDR